MLLDCRVTHVMCADTSSSNDAYAAATAGFVSPDVFQLHLALPFDAMPSYTASEIAAAVAILDDAVDAGTNLAPHFAHWSNLQRRTVAMAMGGAEAAWADAKAKAAGGAPVRAPPSSPRRIAVRKVAESFPSIQNYFDSAVTYQERFRGEPSGGFPQGDDVPSRSAGAASSHPGPGGIQTWLRRPPTPSCWPGSCSAKKFVVPRTSRRPAVRSQ